MGKTNELILDAIRRLGRQATLDELARLTRRRARDLKRRQIRTLVEAGLIVEQRENFYELHCDFGWNLEFERVYSGEKDAEDRDRRNYKKQRDEFREAWGRGEVTSSKPNSRGSK